MITGWKGNRNFSEAFQNEGRAMSCVHVFYNSATLFLGKEPFSASEKLSQSF
jgi:hypothetical protein